MDIQNIRSTIELIKKSEQFDDTLLFYADGIPGNLVGHACVDAGYRMPTSEDRHTVSLDVDIIAFENMCADGAIKSGPIRSAETVARRHLDVAGYKQTQLFYGYPTLNKEQTIGFLEHFIETGDCDRHDYLYRYDS